MTATIPRAVPGSTVERAECGGSVHDDVQVREEFVAIIAANFPEQAAVLGTGPGSGAEFGIAVGERRRCPPRHPARVTTAVLPGPRASTGRCALPGRSGTAAHGRWQPRQRSPPRGRPQVDTDHERR